MGSFKYLSLIPVLVASVQAGYNAMSKSNIVVYWGQNSAGQQSTQFRLSTYCDDPNINVSKPLGGKIESLNSANYDQVIHMSFLLRFNSTGGQPVLNFANQGDICTTFTGTDLFSCPEIEADIQSCQSQGKTIMLSLGGDAYTEGGFTSTALATASADKVWAMFGPVQSGSSSLRPFGSAVLDGFDFDFESDVQNMATFGNRLRTLMSAAGGKIYYLSAAPQCPYPDAHIKDITDNVPLDWVNVQYYNNGCGASSYVPGQQTQWNFNFDQWDAWARQSKNPSARVLLGVPANTGAGRGYLSPSQLQPVVQYSANHSSFGGVMMWDASQAWTNSGFVSGVKSLLTGLRRRDMKWGLRRLN